MASIAEQLAQFRAEITEAEGRLADLQIRMMDARVIAATFQSEYEDRVWPWQEELERVQQEIEEIRGYSVERPDIPGLPQDYVPIEEQFRRTWRPSAADKVPKGVAIKPRDTVPPADEASLKRLYRKLALRFHPDLAPNDQARERWTEFMRQINDAYAARDAVALQELSDVLAKEATADPGGTTETALALVPDEDELTQAQTRLQALQLAIQTVEGELFDVEWAWEMKLKKEVDTARSKGRDLLEEIAADLQARLKEAQRELASLKR